MSRDYLTGRDLRAVSAINYQLYAEEALLKLRFINESLGEKIDLRLNERRDVIRESRKQRKSLSRYDLRKLNDIIDEVDQLKSIMGTAGNPATNDLLVDCLNELHASVNPTYPYDFPSPDLIIMKTNQSIDAFKIAVGKHWQRKEGLSEQIQANAFKSQAILGEPQVRHLSLKRLIMKDEEIVED